MKKLSYLLAASALLAACAGGNKGYTVTGTVEGAADGDTVYLATYVARQFVKLDSAVITNGTFTFKGVQDTTAYRYLTYSAEGKKALRTDFFLENGNITVNITSENDHLAGTPSNDAYQAYQDQIAPLSQQMRELLKAYQDTTQTQEQKDATMKELEELDGKMTEVTKNAMAQNITNPVGVMLLKQTYYGMELEELDKLLAQVPATFDNDEGIIRIKENVERQKQTAVGKQFIDFEMKDPEGNPVKLSDYAGKGKVVLVDFWASWCGPCRREMPNLVEAYKKYKNQNFEIVGVSLDRDVEAWKNGIEKLGITWPQMSDVKYWDCEGAKLYAVSSIPHTVLIGADGTILARGLHGEELQEKVAEALK
ncbi:MAG: AhpC/TSA family protein [Mediterranea sp.]|nr:AhpC/TSA family protein [Mediterranea sp.]